MYNWSHSPFLDSNLQFFKVAIVGKYVVREHRDQVVDQGPSKPPPRSPHARTGVGVQAKKRRRENERERGERKRAEIACSKCRSAAEAGEVVEMSEQSEKAIETEACNIYILNIQYKNKQHLLHYISINIVFAFPAPILAPLLPGSTAMVDGARSMCGVHSVHAQASVFCFFLK